MEYICGMRLKGEENKGFILRGTNHQETELSKKKMVNLDKKIFVKNIFLIQYKGISALKEMPSQDSKRSFKKRG